ncbi:MAG: glycosyltransferase [Caldilineaceae bacterium]
MIRRLATPIKPLLRRAQTELALRRARNTRADISLFHQFVPPPAGGGHQFLRGLQTEFVRRGWVVENNTLSPTTRALLFNSFNFDPERLRRCRRAGVRMLHRVDGPIDVYRGTDSGADRRIQTLNAEFAQGTIFQSEYSLRKHIELGLDFRDPVVVHNTADPTIFHTDGRVSWSHARKTRLIAVSWSDNANKGASVYAWLDEHLDWERYEFTFVGRSPRTFRNITMVPPATSAQLAALLRDHDCYVTASLFDPCSNSLLEALACGLPALYVRSGGHPELVGEAGLGFDAPEEIPALLEQMTAGYSQFQGAIRLPSMAEVADRYLAAMGLAAAP